MMLALCSLLNLMLSVFFPFLNVMMNSLFGRETWCGICEVTNIWSLAIPGL